MRIYKNALYKCSTTTFEARPYYANALCKCSAIKFETQSCYKIALCKCKTIIHLNKALLQGMHPQFMQLLNLKHNLMSYTNALYKFSPTKFESTKMHCTSAVQLNLKHDLTTRMHCVSAVQLNLKHSRTTKLHCASARQ